MVHKKPQIFMIWPFTEGFANSCPRVVRTCVKLDTLLSLSECWFSHLDNGDNNGLLSYRVLLGINEIILVKLNILGVQQILAVIFITLKTRLCSLLSFFGYSSSALKFFNKSKTRAFFGFRSTVI